MIDNALEEALSKALGVENVSTRPVTLDRYSTDALTPSRPVIGGGKVDHAGGRLLTNGD